jgi:hypothetical protein
MADDHTPHNLMGVKIRLMVAFSAPIAFEHASAMAPNSFATPFLPLAIAHSPISVSGEICSDRMCEFAKFV